LPIDAAGIIGARIIAVRTLLGEAVETREDEQLLELANSIHRDAYHHRANSTAVDLSLALLREEMGVWADAQGGREVDVGDHTKMVAFREAWALALNPPPPPIFRN